MAFSRRFCCKNKRKKNHLRQENQLTVIIGYPIIVDILLVLPLKPIRI